MFDEVAFASPFRDWNDVVGIPQRTPKAILEIPFAEKPIAGFVVELQKMQPKRDGVEAAAGAYAFVPFEDLLAQIAGVGTQLPFVDAGLGAEGPAAFGYFSVTAPAEGPAGRTPGELRGSMRPPDCVR